MKSTPLSAVLADDLLLDRIGARLDTDDELGSMLLAVAHSADTPIPSPIVRRRLRRHRGLTVLAALGVAVSGATVAAAVEMGPAPSDQASGLPHSRLIVPPTLQALVLPFLTGTPFQGRLFLPYGGLPAVTAPGSTAAAGLPGAALSGEPVAVAQEALLDRQDQQEAGRQKSQARGTPNGQAKQGSQVVDIDGQTGEEAQGDQTAAAPASEPTKPAKTEPTPPNQANQGTASQGNTGHGQGTTGTGQANGQANGNGNANGATHGRGATGDTTGPTPPSTGDLTGTDATVPGDPPGSGAPAKAKGQSAKPVTPPAHGKKGADGAATTGTPTDGSAGSVDTTVTPAPDVP